jgi:hypothetical protein
MGCSEGSAVGDDDGNGLGSFTGALVDGFNRLVPGGLNSRAHDLRRSI